MRGWGRTLAPASLTLLVFLAACIPTGESPDLIAPPSGDTISAAELTFEWSAVDEAANYWLEAASDSFFSSPAIFVDYLIDTSYTVDLGIESPLSGGKTYYWRVRSWVDAWGQWSETWSFYLAKAVTPSP